MKPDLQAILVAYREITGISCLINTSFNMHEEPIVNSAEDAVRTFVSAELDLLIAENYFVTHAQNTDK